jgi:hypothetical protein
MGISWTNEMRTEPKEARRISSLCKYHFCMVRHDFKIYKAPEYEWRQCNHYV